MKNRNIYISVSILAIICNTILANQAFSKPSFDSDLYPSSHALKEVQIWNINDSLVDNAAVTGQITVDPNLTYEGKSVLLFKPTTENKQATLQKSFNVEQGNFYSFSAMCRAVSRKPSDLPEFLPCYGYLAIRWLDSDGRTIPVRDKLMSRPGSADTWHLKDVKGYAPPGAVKANLIIRVGAHQPRKDSAMWFADIKFQHAIPNPLKLSIYPRVLSNASQPFTITVERRSQISLTTDKELHVSVMDNNGNTLKKWMSPNMINLPWTVTTRLDDSAENCKVFVETKPIKSHKGTLDWEISEPIYICSDDIGSRFRDRQFVINGQKDFIIGMYHSLLKDYSILSKAGFNTVIFKSYDANDALEHCEKLQSLDMVGIAHIGGASQTIANIPRVTGVLNEIKDHPAVICISLMDEPTRKGIGPREISWYGCWAQSIAPKIPTQVNCAGPYLFDRFASTVNIFSIDPYPVYTWADYGYRNADLRAVSQWCNLAKQHLGPDSGFICVIESFTFDKSAKPPANSTELRNMVFQAIASGAAGIMYYSIRESGWYLPEEPLFEAVEKLNSEIKNLKPWILSKPVSESSVRTIFSSQRKEDLLSSTWNYNNTALSILINLSREKLDVKTNGFNSNLPEDIKLLPLEVKILKHK